MHTALNALTGAPAALLRILTRDGHRGTVLAITEDGYAKVGLDGETPQHEYQLWQLTEVA